jgi:1-acyl-sn-glycerol-3-phosphate acyltransferase
MGEFALMLFRSVLFNILFLISTAIQLVFWLPVYFFMPREDGWKVVKLWAWISLWMQHLIVGTRYDFRGTEHIPKEGGFILACKHQSSWETYTIVPFLSDPSYILKRELMYVPIFGWFAWKMKVISVNRGKKSEALKDMARTAKQQYEAGRQIVIYPEGTRKFAFDEPSYKYGITHMYTNVNARVLPAALNSGLFWPRRGWMLYKGTCVLEFMPVIEPGLEGKDFAAKLEKTIEDKTSELIKEAANDPEFTGQKLLR